MITHLHGHYGIISVVDIMENEKKIDVLYDPSTDIESYFEKTEDAVEFSAGGDSPFSTTQIVTKAFIQIIRPSYIKTNARPDIFYLLYHVIGLPSNSSSLRQLENSVKCSPLHPIQNMPIVCNRTSWIKQLLS